MDKMNRGSSSVYRLEDHLCFKVKYCNKVFDIAEFRQRCEQIFYAVAEQEQFTISYLGFDRDHVHLTVNRKPYHSETYIAKKLKGTSGHKLLREFPEIKQKYFWGSGLWSPVIYADSLGKEPGQMYDYVKNQGIKSEKYQLTLKQFLSKNTASL